MVNVSTAFNDKAASYDREVYAKAVFGATAIADDKILECKLSEAVAESDITIGQAFSQKLEMKFIKPSGLSVVNTSIKPYVSFDNTEWCPLGEFFASEISIEDSGDDEIYSIVCYDKMATLNSSFTPGAGVDTPQEIVQQIATARGLTIKSGTVFPSMTFTEYAEATERETLAYMAGLMGKNARINRSGELEFVWYNTDVYMFGDANRDGDIDSDDITYINNNLLGTVYENSRTSYLGTYLTAGKSYLGATIVDGRGASLSDVNEDGIVTSVDADEIQAYIDGEPYPGTKVGEWDYAQKITQATTLEKGVSKHAVQSYQIGQLVCGEYTTGSGRKITFENPYMTQAQLTAIGNAILPFNYYAAEVNYRGNPAFEIGDIVGLYDFDTLYNIPIMAHELSITGGLNGSVKSYGLTDTEIGVESAPRTMTKVERKVGAVEENVTKITNTIKGNNGGKLEIMETDGVSTGLVLWNQAKNAGWIWTEGGFGYFTGQAVLPSSVCFDMYGNLNAGYITTGELSATRIGAGTITGAVEATNFTMSGGSINIASSSQSYDVISLHYGVDAFVSDTAPDGFKAMIGATGVWYGGVGINYKFSGSWEDVMLIERTSSSKYVNFKYSIYENGTALSSIYAPYSAYTTANSAYTLASSKYGSGDDMRSGAFYLGNPHQYGSSEGYEVYRGAAAGKLGIRSSARKLKNSIQDLDSSVYDPNKLYDLHVRQFHWNEGVISSENFDYSKWEVGFIADEVDKCNPQAVVHDENGEAMSWGARDFIAPMLKLIQDQHNEIESLKARIEVLEK